MNYKIKRKSWRRLVASLLAGLCLLTGSGAALAAQAAGAAVTQAASGDATTATPETAQAAADSEAVATPETATPEQVTEATPETAASTARFSFTVLDSDYQAPASGNIDESLFAIESDEARMPAGEAVPVLLQVVDPAPDSTVTVTPLGRRCLYRFRDGGRRRQHLHPHFYKRRASLRLDAVCAGGRRLHC